MNENSRRWLAVAAIGLSLLTIGIDATILNVALPTLGADLDATTRQMQWFGDAFTLAMAALLLPAGLLGDRLGRKALIMVALALFGASSIWCAYSTSPGMLITARAVLGIAAAFLVPLCMSVLLDLFDSEAERTKAIGVIAVSQAMGLPLGPIVGGLLLKNFWWGSIFLINVPLVLFGLIAVAALVPNSHGDQTGRIDFLGALLSGAGLIGIVYGSIEAGETGWGSWQALLPLVGGVVLLVLFALWEVRVTRTGSALIDLSLFHSGGFVWGSILGTVVSFAMFGLIFALPLYFQAVNGADSLGTGLRLLPLIGGVLVGAGTVNKLHPDVAPRRIPALGFLLLGAGLFLGTTTTIDSSYGFISVWLVVVGLGLGLAMTRTMAAAVNSLSKERAGSGSAATSALRQVGGAFGVAVLGTVANSAYRGHLKINAFPPPVQDLAKRSVAVGMAVGQKLRSLELITAVREAFVTAMQTLLLVCGAIAVVAMVLALLFMPARKRQQGPEVESDEYARATKPVA